MTHLMFQMLTVKLLIYRIFIKLRTNGIAWPYDKNNLFKNSKDGNTT